MRLHTETRTIPANYCARYLKNPGRYHLDSVSERHEENTPELLANFVRDRTPFFQDKATVDTRLQEGSALAFPLSMRYDSPEAGR